jgi:hypothetical protein
MAGMINRLYAEISNKWRFIFMKSLLNNFNRGMTWTTMPLCLRGLRNNKINLPRKHHGRNKWMKTTYTSYYMDYFLRDLVLDGKEEMMKLYEDTIII